MNKLNVKRAIEYWRKTAEHDYDVMLYLYKGKHYSDSLFFGHIVLEKILKAHVVKKINRQASYIHDLVRLQEIAKLNLPKEEINLLNKVNDFNIRSRYPEYKLRFYKICTKKYTQDYIDKIIELYKKLCQKLKQKK